MSLAIAAELRQDSEMSGDIDALAGRKPAARTGSATWHFIVGVLALTMAIIGIGAISFAAFQRAVGNEQVRLDVDAQEAQSFEALLAAEKAYNVLQDAERSQRGYVLTENPVFLEPYEAAVSKGGTLFDDVESLVGEDDFSQTQRIAVLRRLTKLKLEEMQNSIDLTRRGRVTEARQDVASGYGRRLMEEIRSVMDELLAAEASMLKQRQLDARRIDAAGAESIHRLAALGIALLIAAMVSMVALAYMVYRTKLAVEREAAGEVQLAALEEAVADRTRELTEANASLRAEIESRIAAETRLRQGQRLEAIGQLTGGIAHDFNNMLAVVISSLELLKRRLDDAGDGVHKLIDNAREGAGRAATLTARLLAFSRQQSLHPATVDVNKLVTNVVELLSRTLSERISVETRLAEGMPLVFVDAAELENALINLAANARDAMSDGGTLTFETSRRPADPAEKSLSGRSADSLAVISVIDTGEGMSAEVAERVFEPFFTTKPVGKGTGLGLSQVHGFLHQSGGFIEIDSKPGEGTRVDMFLPEDGAGSERTPKLEDVGAPLPKGRAREQVLVVEDEDQLRLITVDMLRELGYTVHHAASAAAAIRMLERNPGIDLLFTDVIMPDQTGDALAREALQRWPHLSILYTSGYAKAGRDDPLTPAADMLRKPYTVTRLAKKVREILDRAGVVSV
jgi:signal transduction histidine kinase